jgi:Proteasome non-ATPase 26S subunit
MVTKSKEEIQVTVLSSLSLILDGTNSNVRSFTADPSEKEQYVNLSRHLYENLGRLQDRPAVSSHLVFKLARQPISSVRHAALNLLRSVADSPWGIDNIFPVPGFQSFLVDSSTEFSKEGREWKYALLQSILTNESTKLLNDEFVTKLEMSAKRGPHFRPPQVAGPEVL